MLKKDVKIVCVLKRSAIYDVDYVAKLKQQADHFAPKVPFYCISNVNVPCERIPMKKMWPGWWSKLELFHPDLTGDIFFLDLDTIICDEIWDLLNVGDLTMLEDFYHKDTYGSGLMYLPESIRKDVWNHFTRNSIGYIQRFRRGGDQAYLHSVFGNRPLKWQHEFPNRVISYKAHKVMKDGVPEGTGVLCFHGRPKPRDLRWQVEGIQPLPSVL